MSTNVDIQIVDSRFFCEFLSTNSNPVAVGTPLARRPLRRSVRALLMHTALTLGQTRTAEAGKDDEVSHAATNNQCNASSVSKSEYSSGCGARAFETRVDSPCIGRRRVAADWSAHRNNGSAHQPPTSATYPVRGWADEGVFAIRFSLQAV